MTTYSDKEMLDKLKEGDELVFKHIFSKYFKLLCYEARGYIKHNYLIEEIVLDVFSKFWQNKNNLTIQTSLREYLIRSVHNTSISYFRQLKTQEKNLEDSIPVAKQRYTLFEINENPLNYILTEELQNIIDNEISKLPEQYRKSFLLSRNENLNYEEIAEAMNISVNSVKTNIKNALAKLRESLKEYKNFIFSLLLFFY